MTADHPITLTLTIDELLRLPAESVIALIEKTAATPDLLAAIREHETRPLHGKARWPLLNYLRNRATKPAQP